MPRDFVQAEMVKLGKPRDKFWLPRITQPPPPPPPDAIKLADDPERQGRRPSRRRSPRTRRPRRRCKNALERATKLGALAVPEDPEKATLTGSKLGTSNRAIGDQYDAAGHRARSRRTTTCRPA